MRVKATPHVAQRAKGSAIDGRTTRHDAITSVRKSASGWKNLRKAKLLVVGCGIRSIRFRPHLVITREEVQQVLTILQCPTGKCKGRLSKQR